MKTTDARFFVEESKPGVGKGLFAAVDIAKGDFIMEYVGNKIPTAVADDMDSAYLFEIDEDWTIDGPTEINTAGFINHACDPNVEAEIEDGKIMITAIKDIKKGEELSIDYGEEYFDEFIRPIGCRCPAKVHLGGKA
jgi:SET domain-containing protein